MKNVLKAGLIALILSATLTACEYGDKSKKTPGDTTQTAAKPDSAAIKKTDTTAKADTSTKPAEVKK